MAYTMEQANALLANINNEAELRTLISQLDVMATGKITILYGGPVANNVSSTAIINFMLNNEDDIRVIDKTQASQFLSTDNESLMNSLRRIFGDNPLDDGRNGLPQSIANQFLQGSVDTNGTRIPNGAWDIISANFAAETVGEVRTLTPFADPTRVFGATELSQALSENSGVTHINGYATSDIRRMTQELLDSGKSPEFAHRVVFDMLNRESASNVSLLNVALDADGNHFFSDQLVATITHYDVLPKKRMSGAGLRVLAAFRKWPENRGAVELSAGGEQRRGTGKDEPVFAAAGGSANWGQLFAAINPIHGINRLNDFSTKKEATFGFGC